MSALARARTVERLLRLGRSFVAVALCAQLAHGVVYGSLLPRAGAHGYLTWYVPLLAAAVTAALAAFPASVGRAGSRRRSLSALLPDRRAGRARRDAVRLAIVAGAYVLAQESLERTAESGGVHLAAFTPIAWIALVLALFVAASAIVALERTLTDLVLRRATRAPGRPLASAGGSRTDAPRARPRPLAVHGGLRAPPLTV